MAASPADLVQQLYRQTRHQNGVELCKIRDSIGMILITECQGVSFSLDVMEMLSSGMRNDTSNDSTNRIVDRIG